MAISVKNDEEIKRMRASGEIVAKTFEILQKEIRPGVTTKELEVAAENYIRSCGAVPSFLGYRGYKAAICTSVNEEVIHGIPGLRKLKDGDIISIDIGVFKDGFHGDAARTYPVGEISAEAKKLIEVTEECFFKGVDCARAKGHLHNISAAIQNHAEANGFSVVRDWVGHGIGKVMHEEPQVPNYKMPSRGPRLFAGMTLAIEPMVNMGAYQTKMLNDNWTIVTVDGKFSAHYENTVLITDGEPELLTFLSR